jgi:hypothetical protein
MQSSVDAEKKQIFSMNILLLFVIILITYTGKPLSSRKYLRIQSKDPEGFTVDFPSFFRKFRRSVALFGRPE